MLLLLFLVLFVLEAPSEDSSLLPDDELSSFVASLPLPADPVPIWGAGGPVMSFSWRCDAGDPISFVAVLLIASPSMLLICAVTREVSLSVPMTADSASWAAWGLVAVLIFHFFAGATPCV